MNAILTEARLPRAEAEAARSPRREPALWLRRLSLSAFRCYEAAELAADARPAVLSGPNGAGKTNLLEAISLFAPGRGLRRAGIAEMARRTGSDRSAAAASALPWAVAAELVTPEGPRALGTGRDAVSQDDGNGRERRLVKIDGGFARSQQALGEVLALVWLTPQMDSLFREGPGARRRFVDRLVNGFDPAHAGRASAYEQALRERARLLKQGGADANWLSALEETLAEQAVAIAAARRALITRLAEICEVAPGPFPRAGLALDGEVEDWVGAMPALAAEERLRARLRASRAEDALAGGAACGPHRSDLRVTHLERGLDAEQSSTGEQKALLVAIVLAHARLVALERGAAPLLLLDEVAAHLDEARRLALYEALLDLGAQAWLTGTDAGLFAPFGEAAQFFRVREARITPARR